MNRINDIDLRMERTIKNIIKELRPYQIKAENGDLEAKKYLAERCLAEEHDSIIRFQICFK